MKRKKKLFRLPFDLNVFYSSPRTIVIFLFINKKQAGILEEEKNVKIRYE